MNRKISDLNALSKNLKVFEGKKICAMVKDNAYGHGLLEIVSFLKDKVDFFGVSSFDEAIEVRKICDTKILIVSPFVLPEKCKDYGFHFFVQNMNVLKKAIEIDCLDLVHIKLNVGMNRYGFDVDNKNLLKELRLVLKNKHIAGLCTHFPCLDNKKATKKQYQKFKKIKRFLGIETMVHFGGSGVINYDFEYDMIRVGIGLYVGPSGQVMKIYSEIAGIRQLQSGNIGYDGIFEVKKPTKIALVPIGYADGLLRNSTGTYVKILGKNCKIVGNVCMDMCFVDVSSINAKIGDKVEILPDLYAFAKHNHELIYEVLTNFNNLKER